MKMPRAVVEYPWLAPLTFVVLFLALIAFGLWRDRRAGEEVQKWRRVAVRLQADSARAAGEIKRADSVFVRDTITLTRVATRFRTAVDSVVRTDTLTQRESVFVSLADSTIRACYAVVESCNARVAARDSLITTLGRQRANDQKLFKAQLRAQNPRVIPYVEGLVDAQNTKTLVARGGVELRLLDHFRVLTAYELTTMANHTDGRVLVGLKLPFR